MLPDRNELRIGEDKVCLGARLPRQSIGWVDLAVAHRHLADDWITRADIVEECLEKFSAAGGMAATPSRPLRDLSTRKLFRMHLRYETVQSIYAELVRPEVQHELLKPWQVIATALVDHLADVDIGPPVLQR